MVGVGSNKPGGRRPAGQQPRLDPATVADDQGHDACSDASMGLRDRGEAAAAAEQLGVGAVGVRPAPLLVMVDLAWHIP